MLLIYWLFNTTLCCRQNLIIYKNPARNVCVTKRHVIYKLFIWFPFVLSVPSVKRSNRQMYCTPYESIFLAGKHADAEENKGHIDNYFLGLSFRSKVLTSCFILRTDSWLFLLILRLSGEKMTSGEKSEFCTCFSWYTQHPGLISQEF